MNTPFGDTGRRRERAHEPGAHTSPATACADQLIWRMSALLVCAAGVLLVLVWDRALSLAVIGGAGSLWVLAAGFIIYFFRDPEPVVPTGPNVSVAPAHGLVDVVDETARLEFMGGRCRRISIFLSVLDVHVQYAPTAGGVVLLERQKGRFLSALKAESARCNENVLIGIERTQPPGDRVAVRQIAGVIARRIVNWIDSGEIVAAGQRLGLIQFGSRCGLYLPLSAKVQIKPGDRVVGGETIVGMAAVECPGHAQPQAQKPSLSQNDADPGSHVHNVVNHPL